MKLPPECAGLLEALPVGVFQIDADFRHIHINRIMAEFLGIPAGAQPLEPFVRGSLGAEQRDALVKGIRLALQMGAVQHVPLCLATAAGSRRILVRVAPFGTADGASASVLGIALDVTALRTSEVALQDSEARFQAFMDHMPAIAWIKDAEQRYVFRNKAHADRYGEDGDDWTGRTDREHFRPDDAAVYQATDRKVLDGGAPLVFETRNHDRDGAALDWRIEKFRLIDSAGSRYVAGIGVDVSARNLAERLLRESEARFQAFFDHLPALVWIKDEDGRYQHVNEMHKRYLGVEDERWRGRTDFDFLPREFARACRDCEIQVLDSGLPMETIGPGPSGSGPKQVWQLVRFRFGGWDGKRFIGGIATDVTQKMHDQERVRRDALTDEPTGLYNRRGFKLLVDQELRHAQRAKQSCALLLADVDGLKQINDTYGHASGDFAIAQAANVLRATVRDSDVVARMGGDEFAIFMRGSRVEIVHERILNELRAFNAGNQCPFLLALSVGITEFDADCGRSVEQLLADADERMYAHKRARA